jgi:hypothetical protein
MPVKQEFVSIEELCAWIESGVWHSFRESTLVGFSPETISEVLAKHSEEKITLVGLVDGERQSLHADVENDFRFEIVWQRVAGAYLIGSRGNCLVRGCSRHVFRPEILRDLSCPNEMGWQTPSSIAGASTVLGYHRVISNIRIKKEEASANWHRDGGQRDCLAKGVEQSDASKMQHGKLTVLLRRKGFREIAEIAWERKLKIEDYFGRPEPFTAAIHSRWIERARGGDTAFDSLDDDRGYARLKKRCERFLADMKDGDLIKHFYTIPMA